MQHKPKLIIVSAPSGAGKTTIVKHILSTIPDTAFSISATSRQMRNGEENGKDYFFITEQEFRKRIEQGDLLEWEEVYSGSFYGTLKSEVERIMAAGKHVVFDVDVIGGLNIKKEFGTNALAVFVCPPSLVSLEERLLARNTDSSETIMKRVKKAEYELSFKDKFDYRLINDDLEIAKKKIIKVVSDFLQKD